MFCAGHALAGEETAVPANTGLAQGDAGLIYAIVVVKQFDAVAHAAFIFQCA